LYITKRYINALSTATSDMCAMYNLIYSSVSRDHCWAVWYSAVQCCRLKLCGHVTAAICHHCQPGLPAKQ